MEKSKTMKLTDLNIDCLEIILEYLELVDLLNVADSTRRLNRIAELVFASKYGNKSVKIWFIEVTPHRLFEITNNNSEIDVKDLKGCLQLLRCFGRVIYSLNICDSHLRNNEKRFQFDSTISIYINKYCADYLENIRLFTPTTYRGKNFFELLHNPFRDVVKIDIYGCTFTKANFLKKLFPNLQKCSLNNCSYPLFFNANTVHFPNLKCFRIFEICLRKPFLRNEMVLAFLKLNPQLKSLVISSNVQSRKLNTNLLRSAANHLQNIETLSLDIDPITSIIENFTHFIPNILKHFLWRIEHTRENGLIHMKKLKSFEIYLDKVKKLPVCFLPFSFPQLKTLKIIFPTAEFRSYFIEEFLNFIDKHSTITHLSISTNGSFNYVDWCRLAKSLPSLATIILNFWLSSDQIIELISKFQMVKKFRFYLSDEYDILRKELGNKWKGTYNTTYKFVELKRKI